MKIHECIEQSCLEVVIWGGESIATKRVCPLSFGAIFLGMTLISIFMKIVINV